MSIVKNINILNAADNVLIKISQNNLLSLNLKEMKAVQQYFRKIRRNPTDIELETIAQTWSEHCKHKTLKGSVEYEDEYTRKYYNDLLKETIVSATRKINAKWCVSVFKDNAGIIKFDDKNSICFKVETHNHPSALEPYGGAGTGIGGVIRDILGAGLGAKPIANTDIFCVGPAEYPFNKLREGVLHPRRILKGIVSGVRDYGNRMGIPTVNGAVIFDESYVANPLVYCGTLGIIPNSKIKKHVHPGDYIVAVGGRTGRDGIHGATFSSAALVKNLEASVVQIGNAIVEKKVMDVLIQARDKNLYTSVTDCGAGGFSSAVGEMGAESGAEVYLEKAPLKYKGLLPWEIWLSEAQERMVISVPKKNLNQLLALCKGEDVEATVIGKFTNSKKLKVLYKNKVLCNLDMKFLHDGVPKVKMDAKWQKREFVEPSFKEPKDLTKELISLLGDCSIASKEWIIRQYDHEVQAGNVLKSLVGNNNDGPGDASIIRPSLNSFKSVILANGINPLYSLIDPYCMVASSIEEALRNVICIGGKLEKTALLDNFCWGALDTSYDRGGLVRASQACHDLSVFYKTPFISGKDSLNNIHIEDGKKVSILPTMLISAVSVMDDCRKAISMDLKKPGNSIYVIGTTYNELGGSYYFKLKGYIGNSVPQIDPESSKLNMKSLSNAISRGIVRACHDCSEGGLGVSLAEMAFAGGYGIKAGLRKVPRQMDVVRNDYLLFSESNSRFIVEIEKGKENQFERIMAGTSFGKIGQVTSKKVLDITGIKGKKLINCSINVLKKKWQKPLKW